MDDYNVSVLSEAKNEYSSRLVTILTPLIIEGIKSIFNEAINLCNENDEENKYLMTFQNFLTRVPKWNSTIIEEETQRITKLSGCPYLEDLLTCVHITQLKILTSIRVSQKQKKIDINIPKLSDFVHKIYISFARKIYSNVYLFEKNIEPLSYQKNMRECEIIAQECILNVIRDNMPVENILRAYIDETVEEEIIEEVIEKNVKAEEKKEEPESKKEHANDLEVIKTDEVVLKKTEDKPDKNIIKEETKKSVVQEVKSEILEKKDDAQNIKLKVIEQSQPEEDKKESVSSIKINTEMAPAFKEEKSTVVKEETKSEKKPLTFNDTDSVLNLGTNKEENVSAPKTIERLEEISKVQSQKRKEEEAMEDDDDEDKIKIFDDVKLELDTLDVHNINKQKELKPDPVLTDFEVLT